MSEPKTVADEPASPDSVITATPARGPRIFAALRHRNYRLFFIGQFISLVGTWMQGTAQGWLIYQLTGSKFLLGTVAALGSLPMLVFAIPGGAVADRLPKRSVLVVTQTISMALAFLMAALVWSKVIQVWQIALLAALGGAVMAFDMPARQAFVVEMTNKEDLMNAIALNSSLVNGSRILGPAMAGATIAWVGMGFCFFLNGVSFIAVIIGLLMMRLPPHLATAPVESAWRHAVSGFGYVRRNRVLLATLSLVGIVGIFGWSYSVLMPAFARDVLNVDVNHYGILLSSNGVGALFGALAIASLGNSVNKRRLVFGGVGLFSVMLIAFTLTHLFVLALVFLAGAGLGMIAFFSTSNTVIQLNVSDEMRGRVMGVWALVFGGMVPIGSFVAGALAHAFGAPHAVQIGAVICALSAGLVLYLSTRQ